MNASRHIIISGTGRAGTTLIMRILSDLGLPTGFPKGAGDIDSRSLGGLEWSLKRADAPYIVKGPWLSYYLDEVLESGKVVIDHAFIPIRNLSEATASRCAVAEKAIENGEKPTVRGGLWLTDTPDKQAEILAIQHHRLLEILAQYDIPITLIHYPRLAKDPAYLFTKLNQVLHNISYLEFECIFRTTVRPQLIRDEISKNDSGLTKIDMRNNEYCYPISPTKNTYHMNLISNNNCTPKNKSTKKIDLSSYDFIDFGCSKGGSIEFAKQYLGGKNGLGIDIDPSKVELTISMGYDALQGDLTNLELPDKCVDFVIISHMLEHLPNEATCKAVLASAVRVARKFVYIQGPWFDADRYLVLMGLKMTWSDWSGHTLHLTTKMLSRMLNTLECKNVLLFGRKLIENTDDSFIIPIQAPKNCQQYEFEYGWKPSVKFNCPIYKDIVSIVPAQGFDIESLKESIAPVAQTLFSLNTISNNIQNIYTLSRVYDMLNLIRESSSKEQITTNPVINRQLKRINQSSLKNTKLEKSEIAIKELQFWLLKTKTWRYLRYLHAKTALSLIENEIKTVLVIGVGHGIAELILALEYPHINFYLTDHKLSTHNISMAKNFIAKFGIKNISFGELDILHPDTYDKFDLVYSVEVLEHIKDDVLAVKNMHILSKKYIYCLVPFAEEVLNRDPERLAHSLKKAEHHLVGYNLLRLVNLFPNIFVIRGCYWKNEGVEFRSKLESLDQEQIILEQEALITLAKKDLIDRIPLKMREGMGIWCLAAK